MFMIEFAEIVRIVSMKYVEGFGFGLGVGLALSVMGWLDGKFGKGTGGQIE